MNVRHRYVGVLGFPVVERRVRDAVLAADMQNLRAGLVPQALTHRPCIIGDPVILKGGVASHIGKTALSQRIDICGCSDSAIARTLR